MTSRLTQLAARYIGAALVLAAGYLLPEVDDQTRATLNDFAASIAAGLGGFVALVVDVWIHRLNNGGVLDAPRYRGTVAPKDVRINRVTGKTGYSWLVLGGLAWWAAAVSLGTVAVTQPGCQTIGGVPVERPLFTGTIDQQYQDAARAVDLARDRVRANLHLLTTAQLEAARTLNRELTAALDDLGVALQMRDGDAFADRLGLLQRLLERVDAAVGGGQQAAGIGHQERQNHGGHRGHGDKASGNRQQASALMPDA